MAGSNTGGIKGKSGARTPEELRMLGRIQAVDKAKIGEAKLTLENLAAAARGLAEMELDPERASQGIAGLFGKPEIIDIIELAHNDPSTFPAERFPELLAWARTLQHRVTKPSHAITALPDLYFERPEFRKDIIDTLIELATQTGDRLAFQNIGDIMNVMSRKMNPFTPDHIAKLRVAASKYSDAVLLIKSLLKPEEMEAVDISNIIKFHDYNDNHVSLLKLSKEQPSKFNQRHVAELGEAAITDPRLLPTLTQLAFTNPSVTALAIRNLTILAEIHPEKTISSFCNFILSEIEYKRRIPVQAAIQLLTNMVLLDLNPTLAATTLRGLSETMDTAQLFNLNHINGLREAAPVHEDAKIALENLTRLRPDLFEEQP